MPYELRRRLAWPSPRQPSSAPLCRGCAFGVLLRNAGARCDELRYVGAITRIKVAVCNRSGKDAARFGPRVPGRALASLIFPEQGIQEVAVGVGRLVGGSLGGRGSYAAGDIRNRPARGANRRRDRGSGEGHDQIDASAQARKPCTVSRKNTSPVWMPAHLVRVGDGGRVVDRHRCRHRRSVSAVLPEPTGPPIPTRKDR